jgi:hypothetical protein
MPSINLPHFADDPKAFCVAIWNGFIIFLGFLSLLLLIIAWDLSISFSGTMHARHIASIIAFSLSAVTLVLNIISLRAEPRKAIFYTLQIVCGLAVFMVGVCAGIAVIVVDVCVSGDSSATTKQLHCAAHELEYCASIMLLFSLVAVYMYTQHRIVMFVDKGILKGLGNRLSKI